MSEDGIFVSIIMCIIGVIVGVGIVLGGSELYFCLRCYMEVIIDEMCISKID